MDHMLDLEVPKELTRQVWMLILSSSLLVQERSPGTLYIYTTFICTSGHPYAATHMHLPGTHLQESSAVKGADYLEGEEEEEP